MSSRLKTYGDALKKPNRDVWPGCTDGRCMPCGRVHDFGYAENFGKRRWVPQFQCWLNRQHGCPRPKPAPHHERDPETGRCVTCKQKLVWAKLHEEVKP